MATEIGQTSQTCPATFQDGSGMWHLLFMSQDDSNRLLYVTSDDGGAAWAMGPDTGQTTSAAPAIAWVTPNLLVAVFIANDPSNRILYSVLDLNQAPGSRAWRYVGQVGGESAATVYATGSGGEVNVFFLANDDSDRLLRYVFTPPQAG